MNASELNAKIEGLIEAMRLANHYDYRTATCYRCNQELIKIGAPAVPYIMAFMTDGNVPVSNRAFGVYALEAIGKDAAPALDMLVDMVLNFDEVVCKFGVDIGKLGVASNAYIPKLAEALEDPTKHGYAKVHILNALASTYHPSVVPILLKALASDSGKLQQTAAYCLSEMALGEYFHEVLSALEGLFTDSDPLVRNTAYEAFDVIVSPYS